MSSVPNESLYRGTDRRGTARLASLGRLPQQLLRSEPLLRRTFIGCFCLGGNYLCDCLTLAQLSGLTSLPFILQLALLFQSAHPALLIILDKQKVNDDLPISNPAEIP